MSDIDEETSQDSYAVVSEVTEGTEESAEEAMEGTEDAADEFLKVWEKEGDETFVELPKEEDGTILIATLQGQFPNAVGLKYKGSSGGWRGVRITENSLNPPTGGWGDTSYYVTLQKIDPVKAKPAPKEKSEKDELLQDLIVRHLAKDATDEDLKEYFTEHCGEMLLHEVKFDRETGKSRGFGFIRFKEVEAAKKAVNEKHILHGETLEVKVSKKRQTPLQLFIGRLPEGTGKDDLNEYFSQFGEVTEAYITNPFRGFGFVTYASAEIAKSILRSNHELKGSILKVAIAEPKVDDRSRGRESGRRGYDDFRDARGRGRREYDNRGDRRQDRRYDPRRSRRDYSPPRGRDMLSEVKDMLVNILHQRR